MNPPAMPSPTPSRGSFLWFERDRKIFAVTMDCLHEVFAASALRPVPGAVPSLVGLMLLRGEILPVLDPVLLEGHPATAPVSEPFVVLLSVQGRPALGLLAERVGKVVELSVATSPANSDQLWQPGVATAAGPGSPQFLVLNMTALLQTLGWSGQAAPVPRLQTPMSRQIPVG